MFWQTTGWATKRLPRLKIVPRLLHIVDWFKFYIAAKILKYFCDLSCCFTSTRSKGRFYFMNLANMQTYKMTKRVLYPEAISQPGCLFFFVLWDEFLMIWSMSQALFQSFCNHETFVKLNLPLFLVFMRQLEKSKK